jgi:hypothetical protein
MTFKVEEKVFKAYARSKELFFEEPKVHFSRCGLQVFKLLFPSELGTSTKSHGHMTHAQCAHKLAEILKTP